MKRYYLIYKPFKMLSQFTGGDPSATLGSLFRFPKDVYPVGRLDKDSEGLLLLSNDKTLNAKILQPKKAVSKTYWAQVEGVPSEEQLAKLASGVEIKHEKKVYLTRECKVSVIDGAYGLPERNPPIRFRKNKPTTWIELVLEEGKNRQVRQMTASVGLPTLRLVRVAIGNMKMLKMESGKVLEFYYKDIKEKILDA